MGKDGLSTSTLSLTEILDREVLLTKVDLPPKGVGDDSAEHGFPSPIKYELPELEHNYNDQIRIRYMENVTTLNLHHLPVFFGSEENDPLEREKKVMSQYEKSCLLTMRR